MKWSHEMDEEKILELLKSGDKSSFTIVYNQFWDKLFMTAFARIKDSTGAEEVVQEVFLQLWFKRASLDIQNLPAYLAAMTRYGVYKYLAKESKIKERERIWTKEAKTQSLPSLELENKFLLEFIRDLSNQLPEKCRMVFIKNKLEDQSIKDVAESMNISNKTAEAHLTKALRYIRIRTQKHIGVVLWILAFSLIF